LPEEPSVIPVRPNEPPHWIILFESIHHVLAAEEVLREQKVWCDVVPVPRDLSSNCGMAVEFRPDDLRPARTALTDRRVRVSGLYRPRPGGHEAVDFD
jgi:hypothetical protein